MKIIKVAIITNKENTEIINLELINGDLDIDPLAIPLRCTILHLS
jgi:hypothetical protein